MTIRTLTTSALLAAVLGLSACSGTAPVTGTALQGQGPNMSARSAFTLIEGDVQVKALGELQMYRCQFDDSTKTWVVFYFSPSKNESYRCTSGADSKVVVAKLMDPIQAYKPDYQIDRTKWKIDSEQAKTIAVQQATTVNINVSVNSFTSAFLISPLECKEQTGKDVSDPVWRLIANNINVFINANTGEQVQTGVPSPEPSMVPSVMPSAITSAIPSTLTSMMPSSAPTSAASMLPVPSPGTPVTLRANLTGAANVPPVSTGWSGQVECVLNEGRTEVKLNGNFVTAGSSATVAHIHRGAIGVEGAVVYDVPMTGSTLQGTWSTSSPVLALSNEVLAELLRGELYVDVHSSSNPDGEVRGQLVIVNP